MNILVLPLPLGRVKMCTTPNIIEKTHDIVINDLRVKVWEIAETVASASYLNEYRIFKNSFGFMKKLSGRREPQSLRIDNFKKKSLAMLRSKRKILTSFHNCW